MSKKTVYHSEQEAETAKGRAAAAAASLRGDVDRASEIADMSLGEWLEETGRRIENPKPMTLALINPNEEAYMPTIDELQEENEQLREELELTQQALDEANNRLAQIFDLSSEEITPEDFEDEDIESDLEPVDVAD